MSYTKGPSISLTDEQVEDLAAQLTEEQQVRLAEKLGKKLARTKLLDLMEAMRPKKSVPEREITKAAKQARKNVQAQCVMEVRATEVDELMKKP